MTAKSLSVRLFVDMETILNNLITECVGVDTHKDLHVACLTRIDGQVLQSFSFTNDSTDIKSVVKDYLTTPFILEDPNGNGRFIRNELIKLGFEVWHYPSKYTKKNKQSKVKSDIEDAKQIAMNFMRDRSKAIQLRLFDDEFYIKLKKYVKQRKLNVKEITSLKNQLHADLRITLGHDYKDQIGFKETFCKLGLIKALKLVDKRDEITANKVKKVFLLVEENDIISKYFKYDPCGELEALQTIDQIGLLSAAAILAEIGDIRRFDKESKLARYAGIAPIESFSSGHVKHRLDTENNRILNSEIYDVAVRQAMKENKLEDTYQRRRRKRFIIRRIYRILKNLKKNFT